MISEHFGLLGVAVLYAGAFFIALRWPEGKHRTFSQHVAVNKFRIWFYIALFSVVLSLLLVFLFDWFIPTFQIAWWFGAFIVVSSAAQYLCTLIPEVGGWKTKVHRYLAGISAACLVPALLILLATDSVPIAGKAVTLVGLVIMMSIIFALIKGKGEHRHFLIFQFVYFGAFFAPILFITYS